MATRPKIQKIGDIAYIHLALVGPSGSGKTGFMADAKRNLYLTTDPEGTYTAKALGSLADEVVCKTAKEFDEAYVWLAEEGHKEYDVVTVDNISETQKLYLYAAKDASLKRSNSKADPLVPEQGDYLRAQLAILKCVKAFHDLPMHVVWTAHQKGWEDEFGEPYYSMVLQGGKGEIAQSVLGYMNINMFIEKMEKEDKEIRRFWATYKGPYRGKDRTQSVGRFKDNLTWPQLLELFEASKKRIASQGSAARTARTAGSKTPAGTSRPATKAAAGRRRVASV